MGREIRKVPKGWKHPKDENGRFIPKYNEFFKDAGKKGDIQIKLKSLNEQKNILIIGNGLIIPRIKNVI